MATAARRRRVHDILVYGASGFVGAQVVRHLAERAPGVKLALAGRNPARLEQVRAEAGVPDAPIVVADAADTGALARLAAGARVVLSTAGPFALHGDGLVDACVAARTHYVDITGETPWVRRVIDRHHVRAASDVTRIVPGCGFDSVPADLGAWWVATELLRRHGVPCVDVKAAYSMRGGLNGGTFASLLNILESGERSAVGDPFLLNPAGTRPDDEAPHRDPGGALHDNDLGGWLAPFVMGPVNTRVVRRSMALLAADGPTPWSPGAAYQEYLYAGGGAAAALVAAGAGLGMAAGGLLMKTRPVRAWAQALAPRPGQGPSERAMDGGSFRCDLFGRSATGHTLRGRIAGRGDPGNRATTIFVCQSALALAEDLALLPGGARRGGVLTPSTAFGAVLLRRLAATGMDIAPAPAGA